MIDVGIHEHVDQVLERNPLPWYVGIRPSSRSMFPIRNSNDKVVAYAHSEQVAQLIVRLMEQAP